MQVETEIEIKYRTTLGDNFDEETSTLNGIKLAVEEHIQDYCDEHKLNRADVKEINLTKYVRICLTEKSREGGFLFYKPEAKGHTSDFSQAGLFDNNYSNQDVISIRKIDIENKCTIIRLVDFSEIQKLVSTTQLKQISEGLKR